MNLFIKKSVYLKLSAIKAWHVIALAAFVLMQTYRPDLSPPDYTGTVVEHLYRSINEREYIIHLVQENKLENWISSGKNDKQSSKRDDKATVARVGNIIKLRQKLYDMHKLDIFRINN